MQDYLVRAVAKDEPVRIVAVTSTGVVEEARRRHGTFPIASAALGRTLTAGLMLATEIKGKDILTIRVLGDGPLGAIVVSAEGNGRVRGYVQNPEVDLPREKEGKLPVGTAVGKGMLHVSKDLGLRDPFVGSCELVSGEIGEDIAYYLHKSEQIPAAVALGVLVGPDRRVKASGGLMIQVLGDVDDETRERFSQKFTGLEAISSLVNRGYKPEEIINELGFDFEILSSYPVIFECRCNKKKVEEALFSLGSCEIEDMLDKEDRAEVRCHFCGENYYFNREELAQLLEEMKN